MEHRLQRKASLYLASPLFTPMERAFNSKIRDCLSPYFEVFLPQEDGGLLVDMVKRGMPRQEAVDSVFSMDLCAIESSDYLLIVLDGRTVDEGAAFELGYARALQKKCYGLQTDVRRMLGTDNNPMIDAACGRIFGTLDELVGWARQELLYQEELKQDQRTVQP